VESEIAQLLEKSRTGDEETAFFALLEMPGDIMPALVAAFQREIHPPTRVLLVKVAWQRRDPSIIPFLGKALYDPQEEVWQEALDGLVSFGSSEALDFMRAARTREFTDDAAARRFRRWLEEALQYLEERVGA
jgi:hypothetical protein